MSSGSWVGKRGPLGASLHPCLQQEEEEAVLAPCICLGAQLTGPRGAAVLRDRSRDGVWRPRQKGPRRLRLPPWEAEGQETGELSHLNPESTWALLSTPRDSLQAERGQSRPGPAQRTCLASNR